eukprot:c3743_g1_i1.p1 GENE.c3743_g1_i1~~c3743_g1_i1.p1  ORF type:complete len:118 (+),score=8.36 c3743_g1_i1:27-380(+)
MSLSTAPRVRALYKKCLKLVPAYVQSPGVRNFLEQELAKEVLGGGGDKLDVKKMKEMFTKEALETAARLDISQSFRANMHVTNVSEIEKLLLSGESELDAIHRHIVVGKRGFTMNPQ